METAIQIMAVITAVLGIFFQIGASFVKDDPVIRELGFIRGQVLLVTAVVLLLALK